MPAKKIITFRANKALVKAVDRARLTFPKASRPATRAAMMRTLLVEGLLRMGVR